LHTAVLGGLTPEAPAHLNLRVVRVSCDVPPTTLGPLLEATQKVEHLLGGSAPLLDQARQRVVSGLRRRLLGEMPARGADGTLVEALNRLAIESERRSVLIFDAVDSADDATLEALRQILSRAGWLKLPLVLSFRSAEPKGAAAALLEAMRAAEGEGAILRPGGREAPQGAPAETPSVNWRALPSDVLRVLRAGAVVGSGFEAELVGVLLGLDPLDVLDCVQRAADAGVPIEDRGEGRFYLPKAHLAALRASTLPSVTRAWHRMLAAILSGELPSPAASTPARAAVSPAASEGGRSAPEEPVEVSSPFITNESAKSLIGLGTEEAPREPAAPEAASAEEARSPEPTEARGESEGAEAGQIHWPYAEIFAHAAANEAEPRAGEAAEKQAPSAAAGDSEATSARARGAEVRGSVEAPAPAQEAQGRIADDRGRQPIQAPPPAPERSSGGAPGRSEEPVEGESTPQQVWINAFAGASPSAPGEPRSHAGGAMAMETPAREAPVPPARGDGGRAAGHLSAAGEMEAAAAQFLEAALQASEVGAYPQALAYTQKSLALLEELPQSGPRRRLRARVLAELGRLHWQCAGPDVSFTLAGAIDVLDQARSLLRPDDPPALWAEIERLIAGVCYDIGDMRSLERALDALTHSSRLLLNAGDAQGAAQLLNDQAAVYVRMGDPVRATHLLSESRKIFEERAATDPVAMLELAETDHLFARIPLHVAARPGRESDALLMGLDHAIAAERTYKKIGARRELGRVWETMGRLELKRGRLDRAATRLSAAMQVQEAIGDVLGLAKTTATLSEVFAAGQRYRDALAVLGDSIALNLEKGSPIGLAYNRRALEALVRSAPPSAGLSEGIKEIASRLMTAESVLGRISLPGERD
jgi:tetratricopeptide (TPR) repeat protein